MKLLFIKWRVFIFNVFEELRVILRYYSKKRFALIDLNLLGRYLFRNPYRISRQFLEQKANKAQASAGHSPTDLSQIYERLQDEGELYTYGETPLTTMERIAARCHISSSDVVFELGCGRGRSCFWLQEIIGCGVIGIDFVPIFITIANQLAARFALEKISFRCENFLHADLSGATYVYYYGSCATDEFIHQLIGRLIALPKNVRIITVSFPLADYSPLFKTIDHFPARFPWGEGEVYLQGPTG